MREIKFRVRHPDTKEVVGYEWVVGDIWVHQVDGGAVTWGTMTGLGTREQYTGLKDADGKEIYEGDRVESKGEKAQIRFDRGSFWAWQHVNKAFCPSIWMDNCRVIGTIHDKDE